MWRDTASPYGPLFVSVSRLGASVGGGSLVSQILVFRALELVGVALLMVSLPPLARRLGNDAGTALWLAVLSPLALFSFVSSGHNDALMVGPHGGRDHRRDRWAPAVGRRPVRPGRHHQAAGRRRRGLPGRRRRAPGVDRAARWRVVAESAAITVLVVVGVTFGAGLGWTWLGPAALHVPTELKVLITPLVSVGSFAGGRAARRSACPSPSADGITVVQDLGALARRHGHPLDGPPHPGPRRRPPVRPGPGRPRRAEPDAVALVPDVGGGRAGRHLGPALEGAWPPWRRSACWWSGPAARRCSTAATTGWRARARRRLGAWFVASGTWRRTIGGPVGAA